MGKPTGAVTKDSSRKPIPHDVPKTRTKCNQTNEKIISMLNKHAITTKGSGSGIKITVNEYVFLSLRGFRIILSDHAIFKFETRCTKELQILRHGK